MMKARLLKDHVGCFRGHPQPMETYKGQRPWPLEQRPEKPVWVIQSGAFPQIVMRCHIHEFNLLIEIRRAGFVSSMKGAAQRKSQLQGHFPRCWPAQLTSNIWPGQTWLWDPWPQCPNLANMLMSGARPGEPEPQGQPSLHTLNVI